MSTTTGLGREVTGTVQLSSDYSDGGMRVKLVASTPSDECHVYGAEVVDTINFYKLELESMSPYTGCYEGSPCGVVDEGEAPDVRVALSQAGQPISGATVYLTTEDDHEGPDDPPAESKILPTSTVLTDDNGEALVTIGNNGSASITSTHPLQTMVDATTGGDPGICSSGSIAAASLRPAFLFAGKTDAGVCAASIEQSYLSLPDPDKPDKQCLHAFNDAEVGGCPSRLVGIKLELYNADGTALDNNFQVEKIEGGTIDTTTSCDNGDKETLFEDDCTAWDDDLPNGQRWDFTTEDKCDLPPFDIDPQTFFVFSKVEWRQQPPAGRRMDVTLYWDCVGDCSGVEGLEQRFELVTP